MWRWKDEFISAQLKKLWRSVHIRGFSAIEIRFSLDFAVRHSSWSVNVVAMMRLGTSFSSKTSSEEKVPVFPVKPTLKSAKQVQKYTKYTHSTCLWLAWVHLIILWGKCEDKIGETSEGKWISNTEFSVFYRTCASKNKSELCVTVIDDLKLQKMKQNDFYRTQQETLQSTDKHLKYSSLCNTSSNFHLQRQNIQDVVKKIKLRWHKNLWQHRLKHFKILFNMWQKGHSALKLDSNSPDWYRMDACFNVLP